MPKSRLGMICSQLLLITFYLFAFSKITSAQSAADARALERLKWMRQKEVPKLRGPYDFVFIDAWKQDYVKYLKMVIPLVRPGGVIVAHNVTNLRDELADFIKAVQTNPQLRTDIENPGPGGFSVSYKLPAK